MGEISYYCEDIFWGLLDHTSVGRCDGYGPWRCPGPGGGTAEVGRKISAGHMEGSVAQCLSEPDSTAEIVYGINGVCHQMANRILYPTCTSVWGAHGFWATFLIYGNIGPDWLIWFFRKAIYCLSERKEEVVLEFLVQAREEAEACGVDEGFCRPRASQVGRRRWQK